MSNYGWLLLGQTLLVLLALALCGGWALLPFRRHDRPYLWLAAPLTGLLTFGGSVAALYLVLVWPFSRCLWLGLALNACATVACLLRVKPSLPERRHFAIGIGIALAATLWTHFVCNRSAIECGEPTLTYVHNNDMFNYALTSEWVQAHRATDPPEPGEPLDVFPWEMVSKEGSRPITFALLASGAEIRGTSSLFAFDWVTGVVLCAAVIAFGGLFASHPLLLLLLVTGAGVSSWATECRTAYLGKALAYPAAMLLSALVLDVLNRGGVTRIACAIVLGVGLAFSLNPVFPPLVLALVLGGYAGFIAVEFVADRLRARPVQLWPDALQPILVAFLVWAAVTLPAFALHRSLYVYGPPPPPPAKWTVVIPVSLDLEVPTVPSLPSTTRSWTQWSVAGLLLTALIAAARQDNRTAFALLGCVLVVPAARLAGEYRIHAFQGILYPLSLAGAGLLASFASPRRRILAVAAVVALMVGLRVPQHLAAGDWYFYPSERESTVLRQSEAEAIRATVANDAVDVALSYHQDNHFAVTELLGRGTRVQLQGLAWQRSLGVYLLPRPPHNLMAPKARFSLVDREQWVLPDSVRWVGSRWKLIEDRSTINVLSIDRPVDYLRVKPDQMGVWLDASPCLFLIHNGTGREATIRLHAKLFQHPKRRGQRDLLHSRLDSDTTSIVVTESEMPGEWTLKLQPGLNRFTLWIEPTDAALPVTVPLLGLGDWRIDLCGAPPTKE